MLATRVSHGRRRRGFSLTEIMMAITLFAIVLLSLARMSLKVSQASRLNDIRAKRNAVLMQQANKFNAMPYDSLATMSVADKNLRAGDFPYTRKLTVTTTGTYKAIKVVVIPTATTYASEKDSLTIFRSKPAGSPLCVGC